MTSATVDSSLSLESTSFVAANQTLRGVSRIERGSCSASMTFILPPILRSLTEYVPRGSHPSEIGIIRCSLELSGSRLVSKEMVMYRPPSAYTRIVAVTDSAGAHPEAPTAQDFFCAAASMGKRKPCKAANITTTADNNRNIEPLSK